MEGLRPLTSLSPRNKLSVHIRPLWGQGAPEARAGGPCSARHWAHQPEATGTSQRELAAGDQAPFGANQNSPLGGSQVPGVTATAACAENHRTLALGQTVQFCARLEMLIVLRAAEVIKECGICPITAGSPHAEVRVSSRGRRGSPDEAAWGRNSSGTAQRLGDADSLAVSP